MGPSVVQKCLEERPVGGCCQEKGKEATVSCRLMPITWESDGHVFQTKRSSQKYDSYK